MSAELLTEAMRKGCNAKWGLYDLPCSYPACLCLGLPTAIKTALAHVLSAEPSDESADALCAARNEEPLGSEHRMVDGAFHSVTFRDKAKFDIRAMSLQLLKELGR